MAAPKGLVIKDNIMDMSIGDCIPFRYTSNSNAIGTFSELGTCNMTELPYYGSSYGDGLAYFIKVDKGLLICDRAVQSNKSWSAFNQTQFMEGKKLNITSNLMINGMYYKTYNPFKPIIGDFSMSYTMEELDSNKDEGFFGILLFNDSESVTFDYNSKNFLEICDYPEYPGPLARKLLGGYGYAGAGVGPYTYTVTRAGNTVTGSIKDVAGNVSISNSTSITTPGVKIVLFAMTSSTKKIYVKRLYNWNLSSNIEYLNGPLTSYSAGFVDDGKTCFVRFITGGVGYVDDNGMVSMDNKGFGAFPSTNEWDKYIVKSNLDKKIEPGSNDVWHWKECYCNYIQESPIGYNNNVRAFRTWYVDQDQKLDGYYTQNSWSADETYQVMSFRPVLQYVESAKQKTIWY